MQIGDTISLDPTKVKIECTKVSYIEFAKITIKDNKINAEILKSKD
jgi:hypothetical protein